MNWSKDRSIALSRGCVVLFMILLAALDIGCYWAVRWFIGLRFMPWQSGVLMMVTIYLCSGFGWVLLVRLWQLLDNIRLQLVFDLRNVKLLRQVSWCCVGSGAVCLVSCVYYLPFIAGSGMEILVNLDVMMAKRKISAGELAERVGITPANLSILKNNKAKAIRFSTLMALCHELRCQPGDLLEFVDDQQEVPDGRP